jgi:general secretion pathway protein H
MKRTIPSNQWGFSLLELLLTLVVIGLIISLAGLSVSSGQRPYQIEAAARHFADVAEYALDEAQLRGTDMGMLLEQRSLGNDTVYSYQWLQRVGNVWQLAPFDEDAYGRRDLPVNVEVILEIEEDQAELAEEPDGEQREEVLLPSPQVIFFASGETIPGIMSWVDVETGDLLWELEWDLIGRFELRPRGIANDDEDQG